MAYVHTPPEYELTLKMLRVFPTEPPGMSVREASAAVQAHPPYSSWTMRNVVRWLHANGMLVSNNQDMTRRKYWKK